MFRAIDKDNSGGISVAELKQVSYFLATNTAFEKLLDAHKGSNNREVPQDSFVDFWLRQAATPDGKFGKWETVRTQVRTISDSGLVKASASHLALCAPPSAVVLFLLSPCFVLPAVSLLCSPCCALPSTSLLCSLLHPCLPVHNKCIFVLYKFACP